MPLFCPRIDDLGAGSVFYPPFSYLPSKIKLGWKGLFFSSNMDDWRDDIKKFGHNFELYLINVDGTGFQRLTYNKVFDSFPMFSHDGRRIVFASNRNPQKPRATDIFIADWVE